MMRIPRVFHWVWVGENPLPEKDADWMESWMLHHGTDWKRILWAENPHLVGENVPLGVEVRPLPPLVNRAHYDGIERWVGPRAVLAARSDIVRMEIIARYGGIYLDTDVECFQSTNELFDNVSLFFADEWGPNIPDKTKPTETASNYMFGAVANHPAMWGVVTQLVKHLEWKTFGKGVLQATGPEYLAPRLRSHSDCVVLPFQFFMPVCAYWNSLEVEVWPESAYGNHHCDGKWYDRVKSELPAEFRKSS